MRDATDSQVERRRYAASELRALPPTERDAILEAQAAEAEHQYRNDPLLTDFEAFGEDDLDDGAPAAEAR
jgi:hypothetical protein